LREPQGMLVSPGYPQNYPANKDCAWVIEAKRGRTIQLEFLSLDVKSDGAQCQQDYLQLRNGAEADSPFLLLNPAQGQHQNGRLCQSTLPLRRNTTSNFLRVELHSDGSQQGAGFRLRYNELGSGCGGRLRLLAGDQLVINSPNYPNVPPARSECVWTIVAPAGREVQLDFVEQFYIHRRYGCVTEGVELRDGGTAASPLIGALCGDKPGTQKSSGNVLYVRYYSNLDNPNIGFKANVKIGKNHFLQDVDTITL